MKRLLSFIVALSLILAVYSLPVSAASIDSQARTFRITMRGHVVRIGTDFLAIYFKSPQNMSTDSNKDDFIYEIQHLPVTKNTVIEDRAGKPIKFDSIVPGQEVTATFRYTTLRELLSADSEDYYIHYMVKECLKVSLIGDTLKYKSKTTIGELDKNTMLGTVLSVNDNQIKVYIEGGRIISETSGTEFLALGVMEDEIRSNTKLMDAQGNLIKANAIEPFQRVLIKGKNHNFYDGSYGYSDSEFASIQVLGNGEKTLSASDIDGFRRMTATVLRRQKSDDGEWQYVVRPDDGRRELNFQSEYVITQSTAVNAMSLETGTHIEFSYTGLNYSTAPGKIIECYQLKVY